LVIFPCLFDHLAGRVGDGLVAPLGLLRQPARDAPEAGKVVVDGQVRLLGF